MRSKILLAALAATTVFATPAFAQTASDTAEARGTVLQPLTLVRQQHLDFGTVISTAVMGDVVINEDTGFRTVSGGVTAGPQAGNRALFAGAGTAGRSVDLTVAYPAVLTSGANTVTINSLDFEGGGGQAKTIVIPASNTYQVGVGGSFHIAANQPAGYYVATFQVTADYQ